MLLVGPFQLGLFYGSITCKTRKGTAYSPPFYQLKFNLEFFNIDV